MAGSPFVLNDLNVLISDLKIFYEDHWKNYNQINTSIKLNINAKINNLNKIIDLFKDPESLKELLAEIRDKKQKL